MESYRAVIINDIHAPFHDEDLLNLVLDAIEEAGVSLICINGDLIDFYNCSAWGKSAEVITNLQAELEWACEFFKNLRARFPDVHIHFNAGNHEDRIDRELCGKLPAFYNFFKLEKILQLEELGITYNDYQEDFHFPGCDLRAVHSPPSYSENGAMTSLKKKVDGHYIYACTHRLDCAYKTGVNGTIYRAYFGGWLGNKRQLLKWLSEIEDQIGYRQLRAIFKYTKNHENWQEGLHFLDVHDGMYQVTPVVIENGAFIFDGKYYKISAD